jgi:hypothetical protein
MHVSSNKYTHDGLQVNALLESPMQGLHFESLCWRGMLCGSTTHSDTYEGMYITSKILKNACQMLCWAGKG